VLVFTFLQLKAAIFIFCLFNNNIQPTQLPRGYGGVVILWKRQDNNIIKQIPDGNERINV
jgi:hypothetical protein